MEYAATIVITTRNRAEDLAIALESCRKQTVRCEVIVVDDASEDATQATVTQAFPEVIYHRVEPACGYIENRNFAAQIARAPIVISIDDDAEFSSPTIVAEVLDAFELNPQIGAVAIPFIEPKLSQTIHQKAPDSETAWETDRYIGTAHAVRKDVFLDLGAYCSAFVHQGEEGDFCLRLIDAGYHIRLGDSDPIIHHVSPRRSFERMDFYGRRNEILSTYRNVPWPYFPFHLTAVVVNGLIFSIRTRRLKHMLMGTLCGLRDMGKTRRAPVNIDTYQKSRRLRKAGPHRIPVAPPDHS